MNMKRFFDLGFVILALLSSSFQPAVADSLSGAYLGAGTGLNITNNYNLIKTFGYNHQSGQPYTGYIGNVTGYSVPVFAYAGYRFNKYLATEATYTYSGNQGYSRAPNYDSVPGNEEFWGSQNTFGISALGYLPVVKDLYLKARTGIGYSLDTMTTYIGDPGTKNVTSILGLGAEYYMTKNLSLDFDYINYGLIIPIKLHYTPFSGASGMNLGTIDSIIINDFFLSLTVHF